MRKGSVGQDDKLSSPILVHITKMAGGKLRGEGDRQLLFHCHFRNIMRRRIIDF